MIRSYRNEPTGNYLERVRASSPEGFHGDPSKRRCASCQGHKPIKGGTLSGGSRVFTCAECRV